MKGHIYICYFYERAFICKAHKSYYKIDSRDVDFFILLRICLFKILDE